jgi:hypothetical protein
VPNDWALLPELSKRLSQAFYSLHEEDVAVYKRHLQLDEGWSLPQIEKHATEHRMWYYQQDFIRKSVWYVTVHGLCGK